MPGIGLGLGLGLNPIKVGETGIAPQFTANPVVTATTFEVGQTLTCSDGTVVGTEPITYSYQWKRGVTNIGANQATYVAVYADIGETISCQRTGTNAYGSDIGISNGVVILLTLQAVFNNHSGRNQWAAENSTVVSTTTTWIDYAGVHNVANPAAGNQPTRINPDSDFNNKKTGSFLTDDYLIKNTANYGSGQTTGSIWLVVKTPAVFTTSMFFTCADSAGNLAQLIIYEIAASNQIGFYINNGTTIVSLKANMTLLVSTEYIIEVESNGSLISIYINGVLQTITTLVGTNAGQWFSYANTGNTLDNLAIGARINTIPFYYDGKIALIANYPLLTAGNRADMFTKLNTFYNVY